MKANINLQIRINCRRFCSSYKHSMKYKRGFCLSKTFIACMSFVIKAETYCDKSTLASSMKLIAVIYNNINENFLKYIADKKNTYSKLSEQIDSNLQKKKI